MTSFTFTVLTAEKPFYSGNCTSVVFPTVDGLYGIMANHKNMIGAVVPGTLKITENSGNEIYAAVSEGIIKVENNDVLILVDTAEYPDEIDIKRAEQAAENARESMLLKRSLRDYHLAQSKMSRAISRIKAKSYDIK